MADIVTMKAHCNTCGGKRNHNLLHQVDKTWEEDVGDGTFISGWDKFFILECKGCESIKILHKSHFSEETDENGNPCVSETYYPPSIFRPQPRWINSPSSAPHIRQVLLEIYQALQNKAPSLACMGIRSVIEAIMIDKIGDNGTFKKNINEFKNKGFISNFQAEILEAALELGHASTHRGFIPNYSQVNAAMDIMENLTHQLYFLEDQAKTAIEKIPKRHPD
ncbi:DUF4145 domain-containing protein [Chromobacterium sp. IIBBL 290-4]|uniref:DUF4145 domain-containing protein n=1 Tax=Chromobacterium sp. IIBBL 290-4 TaxID=2953890 RepID=UPI0020B69057|nr:DUF4145 domain-containing protein [Chromobacterium sp. IIBBL 290-4]UTH75349.1 DUF4145 domain-containing protein [Chromobacterium sp. IIBBL 290-4]